MRAYKLYNPVTPVAVEGSTAGYNSNLDLKFNAQQYSTLVVLSGKSEVHDTHVSYLQK